ncbi:MAG: hypothetical protein DPW18_06525, partial [Chloroflexi bacterium]|nr:hypothetical protein [Chloroflexota bacterium]
MQEITKNIYIEDQYPGVTLGVIVTPRGLIQIDAPPSPEEARSWRASLMNLGGGMERVLINMDAHPDRTLGARAMDCTVIAHEKTANIFRTRPSTFKAQGEETGADWESIPGLGSVRWAPPEVSFSDQMTLHWGDSPVLLEHHPGPSNGSIWVRLPQEKIVCVVSFSDRDGGMTRHPMSPTWPREMLSTATFTDAGDGRTELTVRWRPLNA